MLGKKRTARGGVSPQPAAVPKRRGLHEAGAEDGGDAEDDEGADVHGALPRLLIDICRSVGAGLRGKQGLCAAPRGKMAVARTLAPAGGQHPPGRRAVTIEA